MPQRATPPKPAVESSVPERGSASALPPTGAKPAATTVKRKTRDPVVVKLPADAAPPATPPAPHTARPKRALPAERVPAVVAKGANRPASVPATKPATAQPGGPMRLTPTRGAKALAPRPVPAKVETAPSPPPVTAKRPPPPRRTARLMPVGALPPAHIPREAMVGPRQDRYLLYALGISVFVHLVALTIHFSPFDLRSLADKGPPLEVALVNAKTVAKPTKADILAQANLDGGGNTDEDRRAKTPLPVLPKNTPDQLVAAATQKVEALERETQDLITRLKSAAPVASAVPKPMDATERTDLPTANEMMQRTLEALRLEAQIAKDMEAYQKRPKRRFVGARAEEYRFARYVEDWRLKIERVGNLNYPEAARSQRLYGSLLMTVSIRSDGSVENVEVVRTSGNRILDAAAVKIVQMSGPFMAFPADIRRDTDVLHITRTWTFTKADALVSN